MKIIFWTVVILGGIYLLLVIPAGVAVWVKERRFARSEDRDVVLSLINEYRQKVTADEQATVGLTKKSWGEVVEKNNTKYDVQLSAKKLRDPATYKVFISVGKLNPVVIGHAEAFIVSFSK